MNTLESGMLPQQERKTYRIEHLPGIDVVISLNYSDKQDQRDILDILRSGMAANKKLEDIIEQIGELENSDGGNRFFVKWKGLASQESVDFILGRTDVDPLTKASGQNASRQTRFAFNSVTNEIALAPTIKKLVAQEDFQTLVKKYGFASLDFAEPIMAIVERSTKEKYLFYRCIDGTEAHLMVEKRLLKEKNFRGIAKELKKLFLKNGIVAHDLSSYRWDQFMVAPGNNLFLFDIEAYTPEARTISTNNNRAID